MTRKVAFTLLAVLLIAGVLGGIKGLQISALASQGKSFVPPPAAVTAAKVEVDHWQPSVGAVGTVVAVQGVMVSAEVAGVVRKIAFDSGAPVRRGALLVELDRETERAELRAAQAQRELASANLARTRHLLRVGAQAEAELDSAQAEARTARAQASTIRAQLQKKTIRAPFTGRAGIRQVSLGQFVSAGTPIVSLQSFDPIHVDLALPQRWLGRLAVGQRVQIEADGFGDETFSGSLTTINPHVDAQTRTVALRATLRNPDGRLRPGMFVGARVVFPEKNRVLAIPGTAVMFAPYGDSVFVIERARGARGGRAGHTVRQQFVRLGEMRGDLVAVASGLRAGQLVVTSGAFKLQSGMAVEIRDELAPEAELSPEPTDS